MKVKRMDASFVERLLLKKKPNNSEKNLSTRLQTGASQHKFVDVPKSELI